MQHRKTSFILLSVALLLVIGLVLSVPPAQAQCGSESSSCKNCHEVQGQTPVNSDGTGWHESHAFGDFCYLCHAGNQQATNKDAAHIGMVPPLSDIQASCQSCHPSDLAERADVYAKALGIELGSGTSSEGLATLATTPINQTPPATEEAAVIAPVAEQTSVDCAPIDTELAINDPNLVDYVQHYNRVVLGEQPVNWGDLALIGIIMLLVLGGGVFVIFNEMKLHRSSVVVEGEYPAEVVEMLPALINLKSQSRKSLKHILNHPEKSDNVLGLIDAVVSEEEEQKP